MPLLLLALLCAATFIAADLALLPQALRWAAKPAATLALIAWAWPRGAEQPRQRFWLRIGLVFSLGGDVALLWPQQGFLPGLVSFLLAHLAFVRSLLCRSSMRRLAGPLLGYALLAAGVLAWQVWPGLPGELRIPVVVYVAVLVLMAAQSLAWRLEQPGRESLCAALGGALFLASDSLIALNRFGDGVPLATLWIHALYWTSITLISAALPPARNASS